MEWARLVTAPTALPLFLLPALAGHMRQNRSQTDESLISPFGHPGLCSGKESLSLREWNAFLDMEVIPLVGKKNLFAKKVLQRKH